MEKMQPARKLSSGTTREVDMPVSDGHLTVWLRVLQSDGFEKNMSRALLSKPGSWPNNC